MERDLGELRSLRRTHLCSDLRFYDDKLIVRLDGPRSHAAFVGDAISRCDGLSPFSRECASLWRELRGARKGHANPAATRASSLKRKNKGFFTATYRGVLAAAKLAVVSKRRGHPRADVASGTGTEDSPLWTGRMQRFHQRSLNNIPGVTPMRACLGSPFIQPAGIHLAPNKGGEAPPAVRTPNSVAAFDIDTPRVFAGSAASTGPHRCQTADILIVSDLAVLHDEAKIAADVDLVVAFVYLVLCGLDVVTVHQWHNALEAGGTWRMSRLHHIEIRLVSKLSVSFSEELRVECPEVRRAFKRTASMPGSQLKVVADAGNSDTHFQTLSDVVRWLGSARRLRNIMGSKAIAVSGERMPA